MSSGEEASIHSEGDEDLGGDEALQQNEDMEATEEAPTDGQDEDKQIVKPKRVVRNPQPKLNPETLQGSRGLAALSSHFERVKFKGRGHEEQDLNAIMKTYEYWCHRLFPKFPFDTCIERLEKLGTKKPVQTQIKRIRFDLILNDDIINSSDEEANIDSSVNDVIATNAVSQFDELVRTNNITEPELTTEQLERIRINKERAKKLREERERQIQEKVNDMDMLNSPLECSQEDALDPPGFDYESNIKGKQVIKRTNNKLSRTAEEEELNNKPLFPEVTNQVCQKEKAVQEQMCDENSLGVVQICEDSTSLSLNKSSNKVSSMTMDIHHDFTKVANETSPSHRTKETKDLLVCSQQSFENKENTSLENTL